MCLWTSAVTVFRVYVEGTRAGGVGGGGEAAMYTPLKVGDCRMLLLLLVATTPDTALIMPKEPQNTHFYAIIYPLLPGVGCGLYILFYDGDGGNRM